MADNHHDRVLEAEIKALKEENAKQRVGLFFCLSASPIVFRQALLEVANAEVKRLACTVVEKNDCIAKLEGERAALRAEVCTLKVELERTRKAEETYKREYEIAKREEKKLEERLKEIEKLLNEALKTNENLRKEYEKRAADITSILKKPL
jgi:chromosome segregation ATPase